MLNIILLVIAAVFVLRVITFFGFAAYYVMTKRYLGKVATATNPDGKTVRTTYKTV
jgi:uncharacterized protein YxeA